MIIKDIARNNENNWGKNYPRSKILINYVIFQYIDWDVPICDKFSAIYNV